MDVGHVAIPNNVYNILKIDTRGGSYGFREFSLSLERTVPQQGSTQRAHLEASIRISIELHRAKVGM